MLRIFGEKNLNIGLNPGIPASQRHGLAFVREPGENGKIVQIPFTVDRPAFLERLNAPTLRRLFSQLEKMGFQAESLEINTPSGKVIHHQNSRKREAQGDLLAA